MIRLGLIGTGNMGWAMLGGYIKANPSEEANCTVYNINREKAERLTRGTDIYVAGSVRELADRCDYIMIAVKPYHFPDVLPVLALCDLGNKVIISPAAGVTIASLREALIPQSPHIVRIMPNTPSAVMDGMTSVSFKEDLPAEVLGDVMKIISSFGKAKIVPEELIHAVIGVSGSSPAYTYMFIEAIADAGVKQGMDYEDAVEFAAQAVRGAASMLLNKMGDPETLRVAVSSPGGTTVEAVDYLRERGFHDLVEGAALAAAEKSRAMSGEK